jgi:DNA invertase Pin-like site-specific DNA recombinase
MTKMTSRPKAYSYVRFSTPEQIRGDSLRRQTDAATRYAALHGLDLDETLKFRDLGKSAYHGANEETGHLGNFLSLVEHGDITPGSFLLVESLDRLSRQKPRKAVKLLERVCEAGIVVVTLDDGRVYTDEVLDDDPLALMVALLVAARAHEESAKKGRRVAEAWGRKRANAASRPLTRLCPGWLRLRDDRSGFDLIPDRAATVQRVFNMTLAGTGQHDIAKTLNREAVPVFGRGTMWHRSYVKKVLADPAVTGTFTPQRVARVNGKKVRIPTEPVEGYFPAAVDKETFDKVASISSGRGATIGQNGMANILAGLARCPLCASTMTRINKGSSKRAGKPYLVCTKAKAGAGCEYRNVRLEYIEAAILDNATKLLIELPSPDEELQEKRLGLQATDDGIGDEIDNVVSAISASGHSPALLERLRQAEAARIQTRKELDFVEGKLAYEPRSRYCREASGRVRH